MKMNSLHLRVEDKPQALSAHGQTLAENWQMKYEARCACLNSGRHIPYTSPLCNDKILVCNLPTGNLGQRDDQEFRHRGRDSSNSGGRETSCWDQPPHSAHHEEDQGVHYVSRKWVLWINSGCCWVKFNLKQSQRGKDYAEATHLTFRSDFQKIMLYLVRE